MTRARGVSPDRPAPLRRGRVGPAGDLGPADSRGTPAGNRGLHRPAAAFGLSRSRPLGRGVGPSAGKSATADVGIRRSRRVDAPGVPDGVHPAAGTGDVSGGPLRQFRGPGRPSRPGAGRCRSAAGPGVGWSRPCRCPPARSPRWSARRPAYGLADRRARPGKQTAAYGARAARRGNRSVLVQGPSTVRRRWDVPVSRPSGRCSSTGYSAAGVAVGTRLSRRHRVSSRPVVVLPAHRLFP